jgi:hypothetical protein
VSLAFSGATIRGHHKRWFHTTVRKNELMVNFWLRPVNSA